jgi:hypothetical protein
LAPGGQVAAREIVPLLELGSRAAALVSRFGVTEVALGNATGLREARERLTEALPGVPVVLMDERGSTEAARRRYWRENPARGLLRLIPSAWRVPPVPVDDYAALLLAERLAAAEA